MWSYRQVIVIPPYLLKHVFSRGHHIVSVNDELDNILLGIYCRKQANNDKNSAIYEFICLAMDCAGTALPCNMEN